jgi:hypothetical protein
MKLQDQKIDIVDLVSQGSVGLKRAMVRILGRVAHDGSQH